MGLTETFAALSDPVRREIVALLRNGKLSAGEIAGHFDVTGPAISYHLKKLKEANLVVESKEKNYIYYEFNPIAFNPVLHWIEASPETLKELSDK
ncbi:MAG: transcriptional regulator [Firmicutes bacterium HGW-Firmicutes-16]|nr:MAG: transcriptional regulator [Firmicutes bacterium HGW-Firmicutes-16]